MACSAVLAAALLVAGGRIGLLPGTTGASAQVPLDPAGISSPIRSLIGLQPYYPDVSDFIQDPLAAQQLGKALFWDTRVGSDGVACASCHFHAGADIRISNQVDPGLRGGDPKFNARGSGGRVGPNQTFVPDDFPFHRLQQVDDRESPVTFDSNDVFSSAGTFGGDFVTSIRGIGRRSGLLVSAMASATASANTTAGGANKILLVNLRDRLNGLIWMPGKTEACNLTYQPLDPLDPTKGSPFHADGLIYRKVEPRNSPSTVNAVFNIRQFWDGRANRQFNGIDPFGRRTYIQEMVDPIDPNYKLGNPNASTTGIIVSLASLVPKGPVSLELRQPLIDNASLASQAVGPPLSDFEMSCGGKTFKDLGRKLVPMTALATQAVDPLDSLFSKTPGLIKPSGVPGLNTSYEALIKKAFKPKYWSATGRYVIDPVTRKPVQKFVGGFTQMEHNFSLFWGLAIQAYEQLLISDNTPFDRYMSGDSTAMSPEAVRGMAVFNTKGKCVECHAGATLTSAAATNDFLSSPTPIEGMLMKDGHWAMYDEGFYNIGVRPTAEDIGNGGLDPYGFDLSYTRQFRWRFYVGGAPSSVDNFDVTPCIFIGQGGCLIIPDPQRDAVDGAFKVPGLRNVALTAPYFHNGGTSNLKDVIAFYNRGGDRRKTSAGDTTGLAAMTPFNETNATNLAPHIGESVGSTIKGLGLTKSEMDDLLEFLLALTDDRVACHSDVFDHPELPLPNGHKQTKTPGTPLAADNIVTLPATGRLGLRAVTGECFPNSGDLFGSINKKDPRGTQATFQNIVAGRKRR